MRLKCSLLLLQNRIVVAHRRTFVRQLLSMLIVHYDCRYRLSIGMDVSRCHSGDRSNDCSTIHKRPIRPMGRSTPSTDISISRRSKRCRSRSNTAMARKQKHHRSQEVEKRTRLRFCPFAWREATDAPIDDQFDRTNNDSSDFKDPHRSLSPRLMFLAESTF